MNFWMSLGGLVELQLVSAEPEQALSAISSAGIGLYQIRHEKDLTLELTVKRTDQKALAALAKKRGESLTVLREQGIYYTLRRLRKRKLLLFGMGLLVSLALYLPTKVLFVQVEGNETVAANQILSAARDSGIRFGTSRRRVRSERVKNALLDAVPELQWAGVNTRGCTAIISVRERTQEKLPENNNVVASLVADRDGFILSSVVTRGTGLVRPGQAVKKGEVLISGYTDCGLTIQATCAKGEILAQTRRTLEAVIPAQTLRRGEAIEKIRRVSLRLGKKSIFFWKDSGILDASCDRISKEYRLTLPGGFSLPVSVWVNTYTRYETAPAEVPREDASLGLRRFAGQYLKDQMVAGEIQHQLQPVTREGDLFRLRGSYVCREIIGKLRLEQIGE